MLLWNDRTLGIWWGQKNVPLSISKNKYENWDTVIRILFKKGVKEITQYINAIINQNKVLFL